VTLSAADIVTGAEMACAAAPAVTVRAGVVPANVGVPPAPGAMVYEDPPPRVGWLTVIAASRLTVSAAAAVVRLAVAVDPLGTEPPDQLAGSFQMEVPPADGTQLWARAAGASMTRVRTTDSPTSAALPPPDRFRIRLRPGGVSRHPSFEYVSKPKR
jgi:hypothetical protein